MPRAETPRVALVVTTFERPDALARVLDSAHAQSRPPERLVVADDGSGETTRRIVEAFARRAGFPVVHAWQPHEGWRVCRARNAAVARCREDYVITVDGDMLLDRDFVADHVRHARRGCWVQGCRLPLSPQATARLIGTTEPAALARRTDTDGRHRLQALRVPWLARRLGGLANGWLAVKGCNQAFWRDDLLRVNGWDESLRGWGPEDKELAARLQNAGVARRSLAFGALAWHLHHPPADRSHAKAGQALLARTRRTRRTRCERGLDAHLAESPPGEGVV
ncbi:MAG: glycosyltransferase [Steroidobacteraceae bacterium]|nr:glycosyltransferase [Steroidobacteraceae bacterium]